MQLSQLLNNRYTRYTLLSFLVGVLMFIILTIIDMLFDEFVLSVGLRLLLSVLASGFIVYKFLLPKMW